MSTRKFPAIQLRQHGQTLYLLSIPAHVLLDPAVAKVDVWRPDLQEDSTEEYINQQGYQRSPMPRHFTKVSTYIRKADSILPTNILLSARSRLTFTRYETNSNAGILVLTEDNLPLWIIDGQHRLEGIRHAIEEKSSAELLDFPVVVCILDDIVKYTEVNQFYIVNKTAKGIRTDLADRLLGIMARVRPEEVKGLIPPANLWRLEAVPLTRMMNEQPDSPWTGRIRPPNSPKGQTIIAERSFSTSLKPILLDATMGAYEHEVLVKWLTTFWSVIADLMPPAFQNPQDYAVQKTPGVYTFHMVAPRIFSLWLREGGEGKEGIRRILTDNAQISEYFTRDDYWRSGSGEGASTSGMGGFTRLANDIAEVLPEASLPDIGKMLQ